MATDSSAVEVSASFIPSHSSVLTFLIADIRGYTRFTFEHGDEAAARLTDRFAALCEGVLNAHDGRVIELRGDEVLGVFSSARQAIRGAVALQDAFKHAVAEDPFLHFSVGIGLDAGEPIPMRGGYRGGALNLAARLCSIAGGNEILASETVTALARKTEGLIFADRGQVTLKGLSTPVRVLQIAPEGELEAQLPPLQPILVTHPTNLPDDPTPFIGRESEIAAIRSLLQQPHVRLVTLTGTAGTGKTRLALQAGNSLLYAFRDGIFFCDLSSLTDPGLVPTAIASVLGIKEQAGKDLLETLGTNLADKHLLLVLDNFEHLLDARGVVRTLLDVCRDLHILVTSRIPLQLRREHEHAVSPLAVPDPRQIKAAAGLSQYEAVALFIERAKAARDSFTVTDENAPAVAEICARLDGLPLAIELAAARIRLFPPHALLRRLDSRLQLLTGGARDLPERQRTLRGTLDWSYSLLDEAERVLFARLSVFAGGWTCESAEAVCNADGTLAIDIVDGIASLVEKSLIRQAGADEPRFTLLETIREYATERLETCGEAEAMRHRHASMCIELAERAERAIRGGQAQEGVNELEHEHDNMRAALAWLLKIGDKAGALRLASAVWLFWQAHGHYREGRRWLESALHLPQAVPAAVRAKALRGATGLTRYEDLDTAIAYGEESLALYREAGDADGVIAMCANLSGIVFWRGEDDRAGTLLDEALAVAQQVGNDKVIPSILMHQAGFACEAGDKDTAAELWRRTVTLKRSCGDSIQLANMLCGLAGAEFELGHYDRVEPLIQEGMDAAWSMGDREDVSQLVGLRVLLALSQCEPQAARDSLKMCLTLAQQSGSEFAQEGGLRIAACVAATEGLGMETVLLLAASDAERQKRGGRTLRGLERIYEPFISKARPLLDDVAWQEAWETGQAMSLDQAVEYALEML